MFRGGQLLVVDVNRDYPGSSQDSPDNGADPYHSAADYNHRIGVADAGPVDSMKPDGQRLDHRQAIDREAVIRGQGAPWQADQLAHCAVPLYSQGLIVLTGVGTTPSAGRTGAAVTVGQYRNRLAQSYRPGNRRAPLFNDRADFVARYPGILNQGILPQVGRKIAAAEPNLVYSQQYLVLTAFWIGQCRYFAFTWFGNLKTSHYAHLLAIW